MHLCIFACVLAGMRACSFVCVCVCVGVSACVGNVGVGAFIDERVNMRARPCPHVSTLQVRAHVSVLAQHARF